jgi:hypothetical protein
LWRSASLSTMVVFALTHEKKALAGERGKLESAERK